MKAVRCREGRVHVEDVAVPSGDGVRVHVRSAGICGSDLHMMDVGWPLEHTMGHELAGVLDDGRAVAVEPMAPCGECDLCVRGAYNLCTEGPDIILGVGRDGGMAEQVLVPERALVPLPSGVEPEVACLVEPLAVAVHGMRAVGLAPGGRVAVVGGGSIGLCAVAVAASSGAEVALVARHDSQKAAGERLGARLEPDGDYDVVIDCAGTTGALEQAVELCRPLGSLMLLATYWEGPMSLPGFDLCAKEVRVVPSAMYARRGASRDVDVAASVLAGRPEIAEAMISHRFPLEAAEEAFEVAADRKAGAIKVVLEP